MSQEPPLADETESEAREPGKRPRRLLGDLVQSMRPTLKLVAREHVRSVPDCKEDESDIVQRSMVKAIQRIGQFRGETPGQWRAWLVAIVRNQAKDVRRYWAQERRAHQNEEQAEQVLHEVADRSVGPPDQALDDEESRQRLDAAIARLSIQDQQLVRWRVIQFVTYREIAMRLKITEPTARRRCEAALNALREAWQPD
jgi:RNA polymerase sigma-70 factor (ECF subfamily)